MEALKEYELKLPRRFDDYSESEILNLPVQVVLCVENHMLTNEYHTGAFGTALELAHMCHDLSKLYGPMYGEVKGKPAIRFESREAYERLSE